MIHPAFMPLTPASGEISAGWHRLPIRVIYADTDAGGVVYHANYLNFAERSRHEMFRAVGLSSTKFGDEDELFFVVRSAKIDYRAPARLDDVLEVRSRIHRFGGASLEIEQQVWLWLSMENRHLVTILVRLVCVDRFFIPKRIPDTVRAACVPYSVARSLGK